MFNSIHERLCLSVWIFFRNKIKTLMCNSWERRGIEDEHFLQSFDAKAGAVLMARFLINKYKAYEEIRKAIDRKLITLVSLLFFNDIIYDLF